MAVLVETKCELKASSLKWEVVSTEIHGSNGVAVVVPRRGTVKEMKLMERTQSFVIVEARVNRRKMIIIGIYMPCGAAERRVVVAQVDEALMRIGVRGLGIVVAGDLNHAREDKRWKAMKRRLGLVDVGEQ